MIFFPSLLFFQHNILQRRKKTLPCNLPDFSPQKQYLLHLPLQRAPTYQSYTSFHPPNFEKMVQLGGVELDHEAELLIFTCFAVATTYDKNNTERPYNTTECKGVIRQLIKRKDPSLLNSKSVKKMNIDWLHDRWCLQVTRPEVIAMRETVEKHKAYYLARAAELLQKCQTGPKPNQVELTL